jgi:hypothetical protein
MSFDGAVRNYRFCAVQSVGYNALATVLACIEQGIGTEHQPVGAAALLFEDTRFPRDVGKQDAAVAIHARTFGEFVTLAAHLPLAFGVENGGDEPPLAVRARFRDRLGVIASQPAQRIGNNRRTVVAIVAFGPKTKVES